MRGFRGGGERMEEMAKNKKIWKIKSSMNDVYSIGEDATRGEGGGRGSGLAGSGGKVH